MVSKPRKERIRRARHGTRPPKEWQGLLIEMSYTASVSQSTSGAAKARPIYLVPFRQGLGRVDRRRDKTGDQTITDVNDMVSLGRGSREGRGRVEGSGAEWREDDEEIELVAAFNAVLYAIQDGFVTAYFPSSWPSSLQSATKSSSYLCPSSRLLLQLYQARVPHPQSMPYRY
jgi:hypothetical protein